MTFILPSFGASAISAVSASGGGGGWSGNTYGVDIDGVDDYIDIGGSYDLGTFSAWFKPDNVLSASQSTYMIAGFTAAGTTYGFRAGILVSGNVTSTLTNEIITLYTGDWNYAYADGSATISNTDWHHVALRWSGSDYEIYLDGTQVKNAESQFGSLSKAKISITDLILGKRYDNNYKFPALIDEVAIWSTPLSASEITNIYRGEDSGGSGGTNGVPGDLSSYSPDGWWRMGDGDDVGDGSGNPDGTVVGSNPQVYNMATDSLGNRITGSDGSLINGPAFSTDVP